MIRGQTIPNGQESYYVGSFSIWHWVIVLVVVLLLFGAGKIPRLMGDMAKGVKAFKSGLKDEEQAQPQTPPKPIESAPTLDATASPVGSNKDGTAKS
jgi:sec-independent protein translocase protein TatA